MFVDMPTFFVGFIVWIVAFIAAMSWGGFSDPPPQSLPARWIGRLAACVALSGALWAFWTSITWLMVQGLKSN